MFAILRETMNRDFFMKMATIAIPITLQSLLYSSRSLIDVMMIGQLGENEVAAAGAATRAFFVAIIMIMGFGEGAGILAAQFWGNKDERGVRETVALCMAFASLVAIPIVLLFLISPEVVIGIISSNESVIQLGSRYLVVSSVSLIFVVIGMSITAGFKSSDQAAICVVFSSIGVAVNILLNYLLIFGMFGFPKLGLEGAAWGTLASCVIEVVIILSYLYLKKHFLAFQMDDFKQALNPIALRRFLKLGGPISINGLIWSGGTFIYFIIYGRLGTTELAVMTIISPIESLIIAFFMGIATATGVMLGQNLGRREFLLAWRRSWCFLIVTGGAVFILILSFWNMKEVALGFFGTLDAETLALADQLYKGFLLLYWLKAFNGVIIIGVLRGGGDTRFCLFLDTFCQWAVGIPLGLLGAFVWELPLLWVFVLIMGEEMIKIFFCIYRMRSKAWIQNLIGTPKTEAQEPATAQVELAPGC